MALQNIDVAKETSVQSAITQASNAYTKANSAATDAAANKTTLATVNTNAATAATQSTNTAAIKSAINNSTYGLNALKTAVSGITSGASLTDIMKGIHGLYWERETPGTFYVTVPNGVTSCKITACGGGGGGFGYLSSNCSSYKGGGGGGGSGYYSNSTGGKGGDGYVKIEWVW